MENFNKILKNYLAGQGLNQSDIATRLGLSRTIVNNYLNGQRNFGKLSAERWGKEFGIDATWLIFALIGINMADLCQLQGISQGRINYTRQKTSRVYSIKVENAAKRRTEARQVLWTYCNTIRASMSPQA